MGELRHFLAVGNGGEQFCMEGPRLHFAPELGHLPKTGLEVRKYIAPDLVRLVLAANRVINAKPLDRRLGLASGVTELPRGNGNCLARGPRI